MSTGRPNPYIVGSSTYGVAWRGYPKKHFTGSSTQPSQAHKIPRHGIVMGLAFTAIAFYEAHQRKEKRQIEEDLPYLAPGSEPLEAGAPAPRREFSTSNASTNSSSSSSPQITHATMPIYPLGRNPGGDGPNDDPDLSHFGLQIDFGNRLEKTVQITDLEKVENPDYGTKGYSWDKLTEHGSVIRSKYGAPGFATYNMDRNPCSELYNDLIVCERKFGWRAHIGDRMSMHEHELVCSPEKRKFFRCREASRDRRERLYRLRMRQSRGEQVGLKSDPAPGETREFDLETRDRGGLSADKWFSGKLLSNYASMQHKRTYDLPLEPPLPKQPQFEEDGGHH